MLFYTNSPSYLRKSQRLLNRTSKGQYKNSEVIVYTELDNFQEQEKYTGALLHSNQGPTGQQTSFSEPKVYVLSGHYLSVFEKVLATNFEPINSALGQVAFKCKGTRMHEKLYKATMTRPMTRLMKRAREASESSSSYCFSLLDFYAELARTTFPAPPSATGTPTGPRVLKLIEHGHFTAPSTERTPPTKPRTTRVSPCVPASPERMTVIIVTVYCLLDTSAPSTSTLSPTGSVGQI
ncbi:hypothetical protein PHYBLDRAFT_143057 [Phycomyces blakesleeanus NRRL 1555(-)]|uniref:Uncharacterized protein n=1 Tax=Phycomyces blakesleeanus (strain ATCC 8743b / DSM 1359 / FGSC 10004 / NBRC 33097 / NRRL 1555) TaxID=763407 RepID=A0A167NJI8_PHYB8|nr:hypothetical protein PHYBLDRAFT_143057 [Phycomyces blakesleeanus NRRL 1555(-)]OAD76074.1 hypothetical protein PHYBLDRAFT_143057 [Phycomyces blakesleeanus NRRL 1555(-)]|eukprot:XP_018294114.1 hypothetical protein PHYBLDRAFT_143057 [Phycomyces blakesleeanus NRRL 1555(-)]